MNNCGKITVDLSPQDKASLENLALSWGCTWSGSPSIGKLIKKIARYQIMLAPSSNPEQDIRKKRKDSNIDDRAVVIAELISQGETLQKAGARFEISGERARQVLKAAGYNLKLLKLIHKQK